MGVRILHDTDQRMAVLYCSTTDTAFGPVFARSDDHDHEADERAEAFLRWLPSDARRFTDDELSRAYATWRAQESAQWLQESLNERREELADDDDHCYRHEVDTINGECPQCRTRIEHEAQLSRRRTRRR